MRCRILAKSLVNLGLNCTIVGPNYKYKTLQDCEIFSNWIPVDFWVSPIKDANMLVDLAEKYHSKFIVLDDYRVNEEYQIILKSRKIQWLQFDGKVSQFLWASLVINTNPLVKESDYSHLIKNTRAKLLLGPKYVILRSEFSLKELRLPLQDLKMNKILVAFGGGDDRGAILFVLKTLLPKTSNDIHFLVISGEDNPRNSEIKSWIKNFFSERVTLQINPVPMAPLLASCNMAIISGGTAIYEAICCNLSIICISIADNQIKHSISWEKSGRIKYLGALHKVKESELISMFDHSIAQHELKPFNKRLDNRGIDGLGSMRVARRILDLI